MLRVATTVLLLTIAMGCQKRADPTTVAYWAKQADNQALRIEAIKELGKLGKKEAEPVLRKWLDTPGPWQSPAAYSLAQLGDPNLADVLIAHLDFNVPKNGDGRRDADYLNRDIVRGLTLLRAQSATEPLVKLLQNPEPKTRELVIAALGQLRAPAVVPPLMDLVASPTTPPGQARLAVRALGNVGAPQATGLLVSTLYNDALFEEARLALVQQGAMATPLLIQTLNRGNPAVEARQPGDKPLPEGTVEARAAAILGAMRAPDSTPAVAAAFDKFYRRYVAKPRDTPGSVFAAIIELAYALGNLGGPEAVKALLPLTQAPNDTLRVAAAEALTTAGPDPAAVAALVVATRHGTAEARDALINAVTRLGGADLLPVLDALPRQADKEVPSGVLEEIVEESRERLVAAGECRQEVACWRSKLRAPAAVVRERAAYELGWLGVRDATADLLAAAVDDVPEVRMAAVLSLHRLGGASADALQKIHDAWQSKMQYASVNQELRCLIARSKSH